MSESPTRRELPRDPARDRDLLDAAERGDADAVRAALDAGARPEARDDRRRTPLLLAADADPTIADKDGVTPLQHARNRGFTEIADLLERG